MSIEIPTWANRAYAPDMIYRNGNYYLYFPDGANAIGVAVSSSPTGPFTDPLGRALVSRSTPNANVQWLFDPGVFIDDDGQAYLYFGGGGPGNARVIRLNSDMISTSGSAITHRRAELLRSAVHAQTQRRLLPVVFHDAGDRACESTI